MAVSQEPDIEPFVYCFLPCNREVDVSEMTFEGKTDKELRNGINAFFGQSSLTDGQREEFKTNLQQQVEENEKKATANSANAQDTPMVDADEKQKVTNLALAQVMANQGGFEIVPVVYPDALNGYKGLSLYIDQIGRFKDLPLNERASAMAQRDVRGDAFVIASYDDPVKDSWARISTSKKAVEDLIKTPPNRAEDASARAAAMQASMQTKAVTEENICKAKSFKDLGNGLFLKGNYDEAVARYTSGIEEMSGRKDQCDTKAATDLHATLFLNRAQTHLKTNSFSSAEKDCTEALKLDPALLKGWFRRATARLHLKEFDAAQSDLQRARLLSPSDPSLTKLAEQVEAERAKHKQSERTKFSKMFA